MDTSRASDTRQVSSANSDDFEVITSSPPASPPTAAAMTDDGSTSYFSVDDTTGPTGDTTSPGAIVRAMEDNDDDDPEWEPPAQDDDDPDWEPDISLDASQPDPLATPTPATPTQDDTVRGDVSPPTNNKLPTNPASPPSPHSPPPTIQSPKRIAANGELSPSSGDAARQDGAAASVTTGAAVQGATTSAAAAVQGATAAAAAEVIPPGAVEAAKKCFGPSSPEFNLMSHDMSMTSTPKGVTTVRKKTRADSPAVFPNEPLSTSTEDSRKKTPEPQETPEEGTPAASPREETQEEKELRDFFSCRRTERDAAAPDLPSSSPEVSPPKVFKVPTPEDRNVRQRRGATWLPAASGGDEAEPLIQNCPQDSQGPFRGGPPTWGSLDDPQPGCWCIGCFQLLIQWFCQRLGLTRGYSRQD